MYIRGALGCVIVSDILKTETMEEGALDWKSLIESQAEPLVDGKNIPFVLFQNKVDVIDNKSLLEDRQQYLKQFVKKHGFDDGFLTSAKENVNLWEAFSFLTDIIIKRHLSKTDLNNNDFDQGASKAVPLKKSNDSQTTKSSSSGCC